MLKVPLVRAGALCLIVVALCVALGPSLSDVRQLVADPQRFINTAGADRAVVILVGGVLWLSALWLAAALCAVAASSLPGICGHAGERIALSISPALLRRAVGVAIGVSFLPIATPVASANAPAYSVSAVAQLPSDAGGNGSIHFDGADVDWPIAAQETSTSTGPGSGPSSIVVQAGDCLWTLVAEHLGEGASIAQISAEVERWWEANAELIGSDPDRLTPGQVLVLPI